MTILLLALLLVTAAEAQPRSWQWRYRVWMPPVWQRLAWCESGSRPPADPVWTHRAGAYGGAFGFYDGTWARFRYHRYPLRAELASPWQQYRVALRLYRLYGWSPWGCARYRWVTG